MKKQLGVAVAVLVFGTMAAQAGAALMTGDIAFTGFNADGNDGFAIVALADITAGEEIYFRDEEWDGSAFGTGEGEFLWTTPALAAGSVVTFETDNGAPATTSAGTVSGTGVAPDDFPGDMGISSGGETIFAFQGSSNTPSTFLAAIGSDSAGIQVITGTGLVAGTTAVELVGGSITDGPDVAQYTGPRAGEVAMSDYLAHIGNQANWTIQQGGSGDQSGDGIAPDVPFNTTAFTAVPEPSSFVLIGLLAVVSCLAIGSKRG